MTLLRPFSVSFSFHDRRLQNKKGCLSIVRSQSVHCKLLPPFCRVIRRHLFFEDGRIPLDTPVPLPYPCSILVWVSFVSCSRTSAIKRWGERYPLRVYPGVYSVRSRLRTRSLLLYTYLYRSSPPSSHPVTPPPFLFHYINRRIGKLWRSDHNPSVERGCPWLSISETVTDTRPDFLVCPKTGDRFGHI